MKQVAPETDDKTRAYLTRLAQGVRKRANLPRGLNVVVVVTDPDGAWVGVSSTADDHYTGRILAAAITGADMRRHPPTVILLTDDDVEAMVAAARRLAKRERAVLP